MSVNTVYTRKGSGKWTTQKSHKTDLLFSDRSGKSGNINKAKKGGGGSRFTWGKPMDEMNSFKLKRGDPNYDSEEEDESVMFVSRQIENEKKAKKYGILTSSISESADILKSPSRNNYDFYHRNVPQVSLAAFKSTIVQIANEFFSSEDFDEFIRSVKELNTHLFHYEIVRRVIHISMERNDRERELTSQLLIKLQEAHLLSIEQCGKGFERLFDLADDLVLDIPNAKKYLSQFLARAVADEVLPPSFLNNPLVVSMGGEIVEEAKVLLSIKHGLVRLERVWGTGDGSSVNELKAEIKMILLEYLSSSDITETCDCIKRLNVNFFHHEVIKRAVVIAMDKKKRECAMMSSLLSELFNREIVSPQQMQLGFRRIYESLSDLELDTPGASNLFRVFVTQAVKDGCLSRQAAKSMP